MVINNKGETLDDINVSEIVGLNDLSKPITGFWEPLICACFIEDNNLLITVYHRLQKEEYHFSYSFK